MVGGFMVVVEVVAGQKFLGWGIQLREVGAWVDRAVRAVQVEIP